MARKRSGKNETPVAVEGELVESGPPPPAAAVVSSEQVNVQVVDNVHPTQPWTMDEHRAHVLEQCGLTPEIFRKIGRVIDEGMDAKKVQRLAVSQGNGVSAVEEFVDIDHPTRLHAAKEAGEILGVKPSRSAPAVGTKVQVQVNVAPWLKRS